MKKNQFFLIILFLILGGTWEAKAFRGEDLRKQKKTNQTALAPKEKPKRKPQPEQTQAFEKLQKEDAGISLDWDAEEGTPRLIRGKGIGSKPLSSSNSLVAQSVFQGTFSQRSFAVMDNLAPLYRLKSAKQEFRSKQNEESDHLGYRHQRLEQVHQGIPVLGGDVSVHFDDQNNPYQVNGKYIPDLTISIIPSISANQAVDVAKADFVASKGAGADAIALVSGPDLVVYALGNSPVLAYQIVIRTRPDNTWKYWIDAQTGTLVRSVSTVCKIAAPTKTGGTSVTLTGTRSAGEGGAVVNFAGWSQNGVYYMYDPANYYYVWNANNNPNATAPTTPTLDVVQALVDSTTADLTSPAGTAGLVQGFTDNSTYAYRSSTNWGTTDPTEVSSAVNMGKVFEYYRTVHNRNGVNGADGAAGKAVAAVVHFDSNYGNAYWDGTAMYFGDGDNVDSGPLVVLDICGHELTHGVTEYSANLNYQDESGALNESFSDVMGVTIEFYAQSDNRSAYPIKTPGTADWLIGEDCWLSSTALRDMRNPASTVTLNSLDKQPTKVQGTLWHNYLVNTNDNGGVHQNSGPQNFFYYLLCEGGSGTNDGLSYNVTGIGIANARLVAYRALTIYCTKTTDYQGARDAWISAANDLDPTWVPSVKAAWDAVGVNGTSLTSTNGVLFGWNMTGQTNYGTSPLPPRVYTNVISVSSLTRSAGVVLTTAAAATNGWGGPGWTNTNCFASFTVSVDNGYKLSLTNIPTFNYRRSKTGPSSGVLRYSTNGTTFSVITNLTYSSTNNGGASLGPISLSNVSALQNIPSGRTVTFQIVNTNGGNAGTWYIYKNTNTASTSANDFEIAGSVDPVGTGTPTVSVSGMLVAVNTTYGTASPVPTSFTVSGSNLTGGILINVPTGYEISQTLEGTSGYATTQTVDGAGTVTGKTIYVRLMATAPVGNYSGDITCSAGSAVATVATVASSVAKKQLTMTGLKGVNRVYNGGVAAQVTGTPSYVGLVNGDNLSVTGVASATFADKNVGVGKPVAISGFTDPNGNYAVTPTTVTANITAKEVLILGLSGVDKTYDGLIFGRLDGTPSLSGVETADQPNVTLGGTPIVSFVSPNSGSAVEMVVSGYALSGTQSMNYQLIQPVGLAANITSKVATITADNQTKAVGTVLNLGTGQRNFTVNGLVNGETIDTVTLIANGGAQAQDPVGSYSITPSNPVGGSFRAENYLFNFVDGALTVSPTFNEWAGQGVTMTNELLLKYAIGGAASPSATGELPVVGRDGSILTLTAIVRKDASLTVVGQAVANLGDYGSSTSIALVAGTSEGVSQVGVPTACERRIFKSTLTGNRSFLRISVQKQ